MEGNSTICEDDFNRAKTICGQHLGQQWSNPDEIETKLLTGGVMNKVIYCKLKDEDNNDRDKPTKVIVRLFTRDLELSCGEAGQAIAMLKWAEAKIGPNLIGVFLGGRVEQYVNSSMSTHHHIRTPDGLRTFARLTARMHSVDVPIAKCPTMFVSKLRGHMVGAQAAGKDVDLSLYSPKVAALLTELLKFDTVNEMDIMLEQMTKIRSHVVLSHFDHHTNNFIVTNGATTLSEENTMLIDMDAITYFYRGMDIGVLLFESAFDYLTLPRFDYVGPLPISTWREFISEYLKVWIELNPDKYDPTIDNVEHVLLEASVLSRIFGNCVLQFIIEGTIKNVAIADNFIPALETGLNHRIRLSYEHKELAAKLFAEMKLA